MIELNDQHPDFSLAMELLALLPPWPHNALLSDLAYDLFGPNSGQEEVRLVIKKLQTSFNVVVGNVEILGQSRGARGAWIYHDDWPRARRCARNYLKRVYGDEREFDHGEVAKQNTHQEANDAEEPPEVGFGEKEAQA